MPRLAAAALLSVFVAGIVPAIAPVVAQVNSYPGTSLGGASVQRYPSGSGAGAATAAQQRLDSAKHDTMLQSCGGMSGASADRCYSELRTTIESDRLKQQSLQSGRREDR